MTKEEAEGNGGGGGRMLRPQSPSPEPISPERPLDESQGGAPRRGLQVAAALRELIVRGELADGAHLPVEAVLMEEYDVARATLREALLLLESEGFVTIRRGRGGGARVRRPPITAMARTVGAHFQLDDVPLIQVWSVRTELVERAVVDLAKQADADTVTRLEVLIARLAASEHEPDVFPRKWMELTEEVARLAGNEARLILVQALHEITESQLLLSRRLAEPDAADAFRSMVVSSCARIVGAIARHDIEGAVTEFRKQSSAFTRGTANLLGDATVVDVFSWAQPSAEREKLA